MLHRIRWIHKDQVAFATQIQDRFKIGSAEIGTLKEACGFVKVVGVETDFILSALRYVELPPRFNLYRPFQHARFK